MTEDDWEVFKQEILNYCRQNLAKIDAYIPSPFVSKFMLDQVASTIYFFIDQKSENILGDLRLLFYI